MEITINQKSQIIYFIPLFALLVLLSGCTTFGSEKKRVSDLYNNVNMMVQQSQILQATIAERDKIVMKLSDRLNKLANKLEAVLAERKDLVEKIEKRKEDVKKQAEKIEQLIAKNERLEEDLTKVRREFPDAMIEVSKLKAEMESLSSKLRFSQEMTTALGSEVAASLKISEMYRSMTKNLNSRILTGEVVLLHNRTHISIRFPNTYMFGSGKADTNKDGEKLLKDVATTLKEVLNEVGGGKVQVYGFTDNVPVGQTKTALVNNNQELSLARAERVRDILADTMKMDPDAIAVKGHGDSYPIADNATVVGRMKNRRVVIMVNSTSPQKKGVIDAFFQFEKEMASGS